MVKPRKKKLDESARVTFYKDIEQNNLSLSETIKRMRKIVGMTQVEYARFVGVAPRIIIDIERGVGNPTLKTLLKIAHPYRLDVHFKPGKD